MSGVPQIEVSVVVATHDRPAQLPRLLEGLRAQTLEAARFEVIVVADGSSTATHAILAEQAARGPLQLRVLERPVARGPAAARNTGWRSACGALVAFTDDDCVPAPAWLEAGLAAARAADFVQGVTSPHPADSANAGVFSRTVEAAGLGPQFETCNIFYRRALLDQLGGFDERYGLTPGGEDTDLAWRAIESGSRPALEPAALVHHAIERLGPLGVLRVAARWSTPMRVFARHPKARTMLYRRVFWNVWHYLLWRSIVSLWAPRWLRRLVLTLHLRHLRRRAKALGGGDLHVPFLLVHDAVECWAVARGALRHRTLVL